MYPIICLQSQGYIWRALRLENDQTFYKDFEELFSGKTLHIWIIQLFIFICALLIHRFLKWLEKMISIHNFGENNSLKLYTVMSQIAS